MQLSFGKSLQNNELCTGDDVKHCQIVNIILYNSIAPHPMQWQITVYSNANLWFNPMILLPGSLFQNKNFDLVDDVAHLNCWLLKLLLPPK